MNRVPGQGAKLASPLDRDSARAIVPNHIPCRENVVTAFEEVASHFCPVDFTVGDLSASAEKEVRSVGARIFKTASSNRKVVHMIESDHALIFSCGTLFGAAALALGCAVVSVFIGAIVDYCIGHPNIVCGMFFVFSEDTDAVAGQVADLHPGNSDVMAWSSEINAADIHSVGPFVISTDDLAAM